MKKHRIRLTLNTLYTAIYDKSTKEQLNEQEGIIDNLKGKLVDVIIAHERVVTKKKVKEKKIVIMFLEYLHYNKYNIMCLIHKMKKQGAKRVWILDI